MLCYTQCLFIYYLVLYTQCLFIYYLVIHTQMLIHLVPGNTDTQIVYSSITWCYTQWLFIYYLVLQTQFLFIYYLVLHSLRLVLESDELSQLSETDKVQERQVFTLCLSDSMSDSPPESMPKLTKICDLVIDKDPKREVSKPSLSDFMPKMINCELEGANEECNMQVGRCVHPKHTIDIT